MKRVFIVALAFMLAATFGFTWTGQAHAVQVSDNKVKDPIRVSSSDYKEHEALVMLKGNRSISVQKAEKNLREGEGAVEDVDVVKSWNFAEKEKREPGEDQLKAAAGKYTIIVLVRSKTLTTKELVAKFKQRKDVVYAEPNYRVKALAVSNDTYSPLQWGMNQEAGNVEYEWNTMNTKGSESIVAVVDTGIDYEHEDLKDNLWENDNHPKLKGEHGFDFVKADDDPMDENGHGTHCAGIIGAVGDNQMGISGVNQHIKLMALRILDEDGSGYNSEEIAAYNYISKALDLGEPVKAINNSWGGGEYSDIFAQLVDIVGEKGAISVFAAGNEGNDNDKNEEYPCNIESEYAVSVAATKEDGALVSFSNYGENNVDVAAPGADILSTVSYDCYNPSIYTAAEKEELSAQYNGYEDAEIADDNNEWGIPNMSDVELPEGVDYSAAITDDGFLGGKSLKMSFKGMKAGTCAFIAMPYELSSASPKNAPHFSTMVKPKAPGNNDGSFFVLVDVPADETITAENLDDYPVWGYYISGEQDYWDHYDYQCLQDKENIGGTATGRKVVLAVYAAKAGDYDIVLDDMGISKDTVSSKMFKKYDFMSGTSMAAPFMTGAIALKSAELKDADMLTVVSETISCAKKSPALKVNVGGSFDFGQKPEEVNPRIGSVKVGEEKGTIAITGAGLKENAGLKIEISYSGKNDFKTAEILSVDPKGTAVTIKDNKWINNLVDIKVTGYGSKTVSKKEVYLVRGKKTYKKIKDAEGTEDGGKMVTDGKKIYNFSSGKDALLAFDPADAKEGFSEVASVDPESIFKTEKQDTAMYDMLFSRDMASISNKIYTVVEYGQAVEEHEADDAGLLSNSTKAKAKISASSNDEDGEEYAANGALYSSELHFISIDKSSGKVKDLGALPEELEKTMDWSMAAYNGKVYFIGGYSQAKGSKGLTKIVRIFDPYKRTWSDGPALPEGRAYGSAIQSGNKLIYTMGYGEDQTGKDVEDQACPKNLIFDGKRWVASGASIVPLQVTDTAKRGSNTYVVYGGNIGICSGGIVYIGTPAEDYGDSYIYRVSEDKFSDTGYNLSQSQEPADISGTAFMKKAYAFESDGTIVTMPVTSGFYKISCGKTARGTVTGVNRYYAPGDRASITAKAKKKCRIKSFKVGTQKIKVKKRTVKKSYTTPPITKNLKVEVVFKKK